VKGAPPRRANPLAARNLLNPPWPLDRRWRSVKAQLGSAQLKTGETMDIARVTAPDAEFRERVLAFLAHKGSDWQVPMRENLAAPLEGLGQHFYLGLVADEIVGNASSVEGLERPVGILQHVFTRPERRRQGICSAIIKAYAADFAARGGRAAYLHTGYQSPAYYIYQSAGFVGYRDTGTMEWFPDETFCEDYFRPQPVAVRDTRWEDWPLLEALYGTEEGWYLRSIHFRQWGRSGYEGEYVALRRQMAEGQVEQVKMLVAEGGAVVGHAYLSRNGLFPGDVWTLDFLVHPNFHNEAGTLLDALDLKARSKIQCYADSAQPEKSGALLARGFHREAVLRRQAQKTDGWLDVSIYAIHNE
jgi:GNAT superfamily N-acetyltransferase